MLDSHLANIFMEATHASLNDAEAIRTILFRATLPPEVLALSFNVLTELRRSLLPCSTSSPKDLVLAAALNLASLYAIDYPPKLGEWSRIICDSRWTASEIDQEGLRILAALDWRLHMLGTSDAIQRTIENLYHPIRDRSRPILATTKEQVEWPASREASMSCSKLPTELRVGYEDGASRWLNGQLTPEGTPVETTFDCVWNCPNVASLRTESM